MRFVFHNIQDAFASWGKKKRALPLKADDMKASVMASLTTRESVHVEKPKKQYWRFTFAVASITVVVILVRVWILGSLSTPASFSANTSRGAVALQASGAMLRGDFGLAKDIVYSPETYGLVSTSDTREFMKVWYSATLYTRHVADIANRTQITIKGYGGRVDSASETAQSARISFVLPKSSFEQFARELKTFVPARLIVESVNQNNFLPEKRRIEAYTDDAQEQLVRAQQDRETFVSTHAATVRSYESRIAGYDRSIALLERDMATSTVAVPEMAKQLAQLQSDRRMWVNRLADEQASYRKALFYRDTDIANINNRMVELQREDTALIDNVETVEGSVHIEWISLFGLFFRYAPFSYVAVGFTFLVLVILYRQGRRRTFDDIVFP